MLRKWPKVTAMREAFGLFLSIALVVAAVLACGDPAWSMHGTVVDTAGAPVSGATVNLLCPGHKAIYATDKTGPAGEVNMGSIPDAPKGCTVEIVAAGHAPHTYATSDFCYGSTSAGTYGKDCPPTKIILP